jgi:hypothetical protein
MQCQAFRGGVAKRVGINMNIMVALESLGQLRDIAAMAAATMIVVDHVGDAKTALVFICGLWVGSIYSPAHASMSDGLYYMGYFALMATMYLMVAYVIAILVKRTGLSIIIYFAFVCLVDNLLWVLLTFKGSQAGYFIPLETTDSLVPNPFKPAVVIGRRKATDMSLILVACAYLLVFGYFIKAYFQKIDLKT